MPPRSAAPLQDAVLWRLRTLAEATGKLSPDLTSRHPDIPWRAIYGCRNLAAHAYLDLRLDDVWEIVERHVPTLEVRGRRPRRSPRLSPAR